MLLTLYRGSRFEICAIDRSDGTGVRRAPAVDFLESLDERNRKSMTARIAFLGDHGASRNKTQFNALGDGLFELKSPAGARLVCYYDGLVQARVIATHGFLKPDRAGPQIQRAAAMRAEFEQDRDRSGPRRRT